MAASWCKVASNLDSHPKIRKAGRNGREVFLFAIRRNADSNHPTPGLIPAEHLESWFVADQLMMPEADASDGIAACERAGLLARVENGWRICGWDQREWGRESSTERVRKWREEQRTKRDETLRNVSGGFMKRDETHETARSEEIRGEEIVGAPPPADQPSEKPKPEPKRPRRLPEDWKPTPKHLELAAKVGVDCSVEAEKFRDHWNGKGKPMLDWDACFRTWLRNAPGFARGSGRAPAQPKLFALPKNDTDMPPIAPWLLEKAP